MHYFFRHLVEIAGLQIRLGVWLVMLCAVLFMASACHQIGKEVPAAPEAHVEAISTTNISVAEDEAPQVQKLSDALPSTLSDQESQLQVVGEVAGSVDEGADGTISIIESPSNSEVVATVAHSLPTSKLKSELQLSSLIGAEKDDLITRLGVPDLLRREPPAEFWQFAGISCVLHVYLYENNADQLYRVTHVELLPRGGLDAVPIGCFSRLFRDKP